MTFAHGDFRDFVMLCLFCETNDLKRIRKQCCKHGTVQYIYVNIVRILKSQVSVSMSCFCVFAVMFRCHLADQEAQETALILLFKHGFGRFHGKSVLWDCSGRIGKLGVAVVSID